MRDIAWCIGSPPLVVVPDDDHVWPETDWFQRQLAGFETQLQALDGQPDFARATFANARDQRLGAWFEFLLSQWLERDERYAVLARNLAVRQALKTGGSETLGELDFVVKDRERNLTEHWEVAVKFYLGRPGGEPARQWFGPGRKDRLDLKLARMREHQLPLVRRSQARAVLNELGLAIDRSRVLVKGRLFYPVREQVEPPPHAAPEHLRGWWMRVSDFPGPFAGHDWRWRRLLRGEWLAPVEDSPATRAEALTADAFAAGTDIRQTRRPRMVVALEDGVEVSRGFLVQDSWDDDQEDLL